MGRDRERSREALAQKMTDYYSSYARDMVDAYWGKPSDIDGNGKVLILASPVAADSIAAFVWVGDMLSADAADPNGCASSNEAELIYFNTDLILDMQSADPGYQALSTVAHEMKHVVSLYDRIAAILRGTASQFHPTWIEEGTAEISGRDVLAHRVGGQRGAVTDQTGDQARTSAPQFHGGELRGRAEPGPNGLVPVERSPTG